MRQLFRMGVLAGYSGRMQEHNINSCTFSLKNFKIIGYHYDSRNSIPRSNHLTSFTFNWVKHWHPLLKTLFSICEKKFSENIWLMKRIKKTQTRPHIFESVHASSSTMTVNSNNSSLNLSNLSAVKGGTQDVTISTVFLILNIIINGMTCPFTVILNALVIVVVKKRPRLQNNANILLACLAVTDAFEGLTAQSSFALSNTCLVLGINNSAIAHFHELCFGLLSTCSCLHLMLVVFERLVAIKFPFRYPYLVTKRKIKLAVPFCWIYCTWWIFAAQYLIDKQNKRLRFLIIAHIMVPCVVFVLSSYGVLYFETRRHQKKIKTQQLPQNEKETFIAESKALKTTALVFGALVLCLFPAIFTILLSAVGIQRKKGNFASMVMTFAMLNSLMNPLIRLLETKRNAKVRI